MTNEKSREDWEKVKPLAGGLWLLSWGIFSAACVVIFLICRPFDWRSYGVLCFGMGMIGLGRRVCRGARGQLEELGENNPLRKYDRSHLPSN